eukprot:6312154-Prymnesium_polylepis.1
MSHAADGGGGGGGSMPGGACGVAGIAGGSGGGECPSTQPSRDRSKRLPRLSTAYCAAPSKPDINAARTPQSMRSGDGVVAAD